MKKIKFLNKTMIQVKLKKMIKKKFFKTIILKRKLLNKQIFKKTYRIKIKMFKYLFQLLFKHLKIIIYN
jgi:hypothetical protein